MKNFKVFWVCFSVILTTCCIIFSPNALATALTYSGTPSRVSASLDFERPANHAQPVRVVNGLSLATYQSVSNSLKNGEHVFLILSPESNMLLLKSLLNLSTIPVLENIDAAPIPATTTSQNPFANTINWRSAPLLRCWVNMGTGEFNTLLVRAGTSTPLLLKKTFERANLITFTGCLSETFNTEFQDWTYFHYFVHTVVAQLNNTSPMPFALFSGSPVPHSHARKTLSLFFALSIVLAVGAFVVVRKHSKRNPQILEAHAAQCSMVQNNKQNEQWSHAGFHRPLGGFLFALIGGLLLFIPFVVFNNLIMPRFVLPSAQALGIWGRVVQFCGVFWLFFDWGTGTAFVKYLSEYIRTNPARALQFGQVFVWWQLLTGTIQALLFIALAAFVAPETAFALYAWTLIAHTLIQVPGFFQLTRLALSGVQRYDYAQVVDIAGNMLLPMFIQPPIVYAAYRWGVAHPHIGGAFSGVIGMAVSAYVLEFLRFAIGHRLYKKAGYNLRIYFYAHFNASVLRECLRFGSFEMLGGLAWAAGQALEIRITETHLENYTEVWGNWTLAQNFAMAFSVQLALFGNLLPSLSESTSAGLKKLSQYYQSQGYKWGAFVTAFLVSVLLVVAPKFILGSSGAQFTRAADWTIPTILAGVFLFPSWAGDHIALGAGKPWVKPLMVSVEQVLRIVGVWFLISRFQMNALIIAYVFGFAAKAFGIYFLNSRVCFPHKFYFWQSLAAPSLAGLAHYFFLNAIASLIWVPTPAASVILFFVGILLSFPFYIAFFSWFGGWDSHTLEELKLAAESSGPLRVLSVFFWRISRMVSSFSPLHNRFPITNREAAMQEAAVLNSNR